ncbi:MAG: hypothetical protein K0R71_1256 [Bacillales bacterium]|jgi:hypothetical protein|nr:hypothetical protein [Bacillales bacterium]
MKLYEFDAELKLERNGAYIEFPYDVHVEFGTKGRVAVQATFDGVPYRGSLMKMGTNCHIVGVLKEIRAKIGKGDGDMVHVTIMQDVESREKEIPEILSIEFEKCTEVKEFFNSLTDSQKNKFIDFINSAKQETTRFSRLEKVMSLLKNNQKL